MVCYYPHSRLFVAPRRTLALAGPHIHVLDSASGHLLSSTQLDTPIRCAAVDPSYSYLASCGDDKQLRVWKLDTLDLVNQRELPKRPTAIEFVRDAQTIIVSDKFGDVFSYPIEYTPLTETQKPRALSSHQNPSGGTLVLGHTSVLTSFLLSQDERYIITADRDEHIRVSWYPQGYVIEMYCLGHLKYVSAIHIAPSAPSTLVSGGGDPVLKVWDWMSGTVQYEVPILETVRPFIVVSAKSKRGGDDDEDELQSSPKGIKGKQAVVGEEKEKETLTEITEEDDSAPKTPQQPRQVLVIHKIASLRHAGGLHLLFNAVGATALFACPLKPNATIQSFDFQKPVLDFAVSENGFIWTLLDGSWTSSGEGDQTTSMIRALQLTTSGELAELSSTELGSYAALLTSLNTTCLRQTTAEEIKKLDFYTDLTWLPKYNEGIDSEGGGNKSDPTSSELPSQPENDQGQEKELTKRELGRLKNKRKVLARAQEAADRVLDDINEGAVEMRGAAEPATKKGKVEHENSMDVD
ncbi:hypothetical protein AX15_002907 [Amanita polypyramis BW_CC]|nr:hypothetical protein AX15_002907 [Amanita polypyramis BW_CC]